MALIPPNLENMTEEEIQAFYQAQIDARNEK
jgi:hypothetical protein